MARTLVLSKQNSQFCRSIETVITSLGYVLYKSEHDFAKVMQLVDFVKENAIDQVLMPNPYGNNKRLTCYKKLKECKIKVVASDRGALPDSWFFDKGFNFDSESYSPHEWDKALLLDQQEKVDQYIRQLKKGDSALEKQGDRFGAIQAKKLLGIDPRKKVIFVPLQRPTDTVIKYFSDPIGSIENFIELLVAVEKKINAESNDWVFLLKKHPLETAYFAFESENIGYVTDSTNFYDLIEMSDVLLLINSGVGLNALAFEKKVICVGQSFYAHSGLAVHAKSAEEVVQCLYASDLNPDYLKVSRFFHHLITNVYSFGEFITELVAQKDGAYRNETKKIRFYQVCWLGEKISVKTKRILVVSPLIPYPIYRGNQARVDGVVRWLIKNNYIVDMVVLNTSFSNEKSIDLKNQLLGYYTGINEIHVLKDPSLNKDFIVSKIKPSLKITLKDFFATLQEFNYNILKNEKRDEIVRGFIAGKISDLKKDSPVYSSYFEYMIKKTKENFSGESNSVVNEKSCPSKMVYLIGQLCEKNKYDYLLLNYVKTAGCIPNKFSGKVIIDTHDYQSQFLEEDQQINGKNLNIDLDKYRESEHYWLKKADVLISINPDEQVIFKKIVGTSTIVKTIPAFFPVEDLARPRFWRYNFDVLYVGSISNFNVGGLKWFLDEVLPIVTKVMPDIRIAIAGNVGRSKEIDWQKYSKNITVLGRVSDLAGLYISSLCCIAPILGGAGMKIKVVEALSYSKAVIATEKALEGINTDHYKAALSVNTKREFAEAIIDVVGNPKVRIMLEEGAKNLYQKEHSETALDENLKMIFSV